MRMEDLIETQIGRPLKEMTWACQCNVTKKQLDQGHSRFYPTEVNSEGICIKCGYYAYRIEKYLLTSVYQENHRPNRNYKWSKRRK